MITRKESKELLKAWLATSLAFGILIYFEKQNFILSILISAFTVGLGFMAHELAHRYLAFKYKKHAEFRANNQMLILSIAMSFFGVVIAAPGAVVIGGLISRKESGMIASAGPAANMIVAILFLPLVWVFPTVAFYGFMINSWMALFNMIPVPGFDGLKIIEWNKAVYFAMAGIALLLNLLNILLPNFANIG